MFGKSDWKKICRKFLPLRSPSQVSSHAQKFFDRQAAKKKDGNGIRASIHDLTTVAECDAILEGRLNGATHLVTAASATPSPSLTNSYASPFFQGRSNDAAIATANVANDADAYPFFYQGRYNDFATAMAVTDVYARPSSNFVPFDDSPFFQGRSNDGATSIADAYARPSPSMNAFDASAFSQGKSNVAANIATADAYARASSSLFVFDDADFSQGRGQGSSPFNFK